MFKQLLFLSFLAFSVSAAVDAQEVINITVGVLEGLFDRMDLHYLETCITDIDTIGYDIYDAVEDFEAGDFISICDGIARIGNAVQAIGDGMSECKDAVEIDFQTLADMAAIFAHPEDLIVQIGKDIVINGKSIKADIDAYRTDMASQNWEQAGRDLGDAIALVFFGRGGRFASVEDATKDSSEYEGFQVMAGYVYVHAPEDSVYQELYNITSVYGADLISGIDELFSNSTKPIWDGEIVRFVRYVGYLVSRATIDIQTAGYFSGLDLTSSNSCMQTFKSDQISDEIVTFINAAYDAYHNDELKSVGYYLGAIGGKYCPLSATA